ncbi:MAG: hypothetical protein LW835_04435 [Burkholderiaceae bacterium]|nr:hypothetical protein [Burkholderiales bacterium]MCE2644473.1 hypothetical protein [Burkholderiaceae bacterium]
MQRRLLLFGLPGALASARAWGEALQLSPAQLQPRSGAGAAGSPLRPDPWPQAAFSATSVQDVRSALGVPAQVQVQPDLLLAAPEIVTLVQPIKIGLQSATLRASRVILVAERLPLPLLAALRFAGTASLSARLHVHLPRTTVLRVFVQADNVWFTAAREVKVAVEPG